MNASVDSPRVYAQFCRVDRQYEPGAEIAVRYEIEVSADDPPHAVEHSVLWYTEGKGEEDMGIHAFERIVDRHRLPPAAFTDTLTIRLPASPLSYEGVIVKIRWCIRVRIFFNGGRDFISEHEFVMGCIPPARLPSGGGT